MAPSAAPRLLRALLSGARCARASPELPFHPIASPLHPQRPGTSPTSLQALLRSFSAASGGDNGTGNNGNGTESGDSHRNSPFRSSGGRGRESDHPGGEDMGEEPRLFGEGGLFGQRGGLFGRPSSTEGRSVDDWEEQVHEQAPPWAAYADKEGYYGEDSWTADAEQTSGIESAPAEDHGLEPEQVLGTAASDKGVDVEDMSHGEYAWEADGVKQRKASDYIGEWGPDGRLRKAGQPPEGDVSSDAAFGDLIRKSGFTHDDIANLMAGFYEPVTLPHLDDVKYVDMEQEKRKKRREIELAKMAEMAKRWVRKVDANGFAHGVGRRKSSSARVWIRQGEGRIVINKRHHDLYFPVIDHRVEYLEPFVVTDTLGMFDTFVLVKGGGVTGQASAIRHGLSRALMWYDPSLRGCLKKAGMLTRDARIVERKKPGKAKARKSFQWVKR